MPYFTDADTRTIVARTYAHPATTGRAVAESLYAADELSTMPDDAVTHAFGVAHPLRHAALQAGERVLDVGCGAGLDALLAARAVGPRGRVVGIDMLPAMAERARENARAIGADNVVVHAGLMEALPLADATVDVVVSNGALNLSTRKSRALAEMHRVLRPGGRVVLGDLVLADLLPEAILRHPTALAAWLAGALAEPVLMKKLVNVGFEGVRMLDRRPFGLDALARYPLFPGEFLDFVRTAVPPDRHDSIVFSVVVAARKALH